MCYIAIYQLRHQYLENISSLIIPSVKLECTKKAFYQGCVIFNQNFLFVLDF